MKIKCEISIFPDKLSHLQLLSELLIVLPVVTSRLVHFIKPQVGSSVTPPMSLRFFSLPVILYLNSVLAKLDIITNIILSSTTIQLIPLWYSTFNSDKSIVTVISINHHLNMVHSVAWPFLPVFDKFCHMHRTKNPNTRNECNLQIRYIAWRYHLPFNLKSSQQVKWVFKDSPWA